MATPYFNSKPICIRHYALALGALALCFPSCSGSGSSGSGAAGTSNAIKLVRVQQGKLVDVYGLNTLNGTQVVTLHQPDMVVGPTIQDERDSGSSKRDSEILYDFLSANPDTLQPRLLITREIGSAEFNTAMLALDDSLRSVSPNSFGRDTKVAPYSVVPRNAAIRLEFSRNLEISDDYFYERDSQGVITGIKNTQAVQLLKIVGDPRDNNPTGDFKIIDARIAVRDNLIIIDPVLLGTEGLQYGSRNTASGMPESPNQTGSNIRLAVAHEGPLAIPGIGTDGIEHLNGKNNDGHASVIRDFRSGNQFDNSSELSRGFIRDPVPPRLIGQMLMYIERVESAGPSAKLVTLFKNGIKHELDRGDLIRIFIDGASAPTAGLEILQDPSDDLGKPNVQRVRVLVRPLLNAAGQDILELNDPSEKSDFPPYAGLQREIYLREHAPKAVLIAEFTRRRLRPGGTGANSFYGDDPRNFLSFSPRPMPTASGLVIGNENVSPFASAILRFSKPVDMTTLIALDTSFFATRNLLDREAIDKFITDRNIEPAGFSEAKFRTPHLIHGRIFDEDGSQTAIRIQPSLGFYLDQAMRDAYEVDKSLPFEDRRYHYFLHLVSGSDGISDLSGNPLDFQTLNVPGQTVVDHLVMEFALDARMQSGANLPRFEDNISIYNVRRFAAPDEDERPNLYLDTEITQVGGPTPADAWRSDDLFGPVSFLASGELVPRAATRSTKVVDNLNQISAPPQSSDLRWCPINGPSGWGSATMVSSNSANTAFGQPIRNPVNPFGCRLQMLWREIDMSLSRTDPLDFNLDVEQLYWAPFTQNAIVFDEFDRMTLYLGHAEYRPTTCIASGDAFPSMPESGLDMFFKKNYAHNITSAGKFEPDTPAPHPAYVDAVMTISSKDAILEPNRVNRFLPLPQFIDASKTSNLKNPYFVWRDEQEIAQGGAVKASDTSMSPYPWLLSPFLGGRGRKVSGTVGNLTFNAGVWHNAKDRQLRNGNETDLKTDGCVGTIALPLLADFWTYPDSPDKPASNPFRAGGVNGWQISIPVTSSAKPFFRIYSAGRGGSSPFLLDPTHPKWNKASGGFAPGGASTAGLDNSVYWVMADFLKRTAVVTSGFVDIANPHRMPRVTGSDPRLGPFDRTDKLPIYSYDFEPSLSQLPPGTAVITEFRGASELTRANQWWPKVGANKCDETVFPLDPLKAGDAHIRHWDNRNIRGTSVRKRWWSFIYNDTVTSYTEDPNNLADSVWTNSHTGPYNTFDAKDVNYFNWRFIMKNNVDVTPPVSPRIESFSVAYRLTDQ